jgi:hypothetical protein
MLSFWNLLSKCLNSDCFHDTGSKGASKNIIVALEQNKVRTKENKKITLFAAKNELDQSGVVHKYCQILSERLELIK